MVATPGGKVALAGVDEYSGGVLSVVVAPGAMGDVSGAKGVAPGAAGVSPGANCVSPGTIGVGSTAEFVSPAGGAAVSPGPEAQKWLTS